MTSNHIPRGSITDDLMNNGMSPLPNVNKQDEDFEFEDLYKQYNMHPSGDNSGNNMDFL